jgi:hypothetical protein
LRQLEERLHRGEAEKAAEVRFLQKVYPVADLAPDASVDLISVITKTVEPASWRENDTGGFGSIAYFLEGECLVINQSTDIHEQAQALLDARRKVKADQAKKQ